MFDKIIELIKLLPYIGSNLNLILKINAYTLVTLAVAYPLWVLYNNDELLTTVILRSSKEEIEITQDQLPLIQETLTRLVESSTKISRATFGVFLNLNKVNLNEYSRSFEEKLPLGFQTVYLDSEDYGRILVDFKNGDCTELTKVDGTYIKAELESANVGALLICSSRYNWFISVYADSFEISTIELVKLKVELLESKIGLIK